MSIEGRTAGDAVQAITNILDVKSVRRHRGSHEGYLRRYARLAASAAARKLPGLRELAPFLVSFISDERTLFTAWKHLAAEGGQTPGPDGDRYADHSTEDVWKCCRATRDTIRSGHHEPGPERVQRIPKASGGFRELVLQSIHDRVVDRAIVEILQPLLDPLFHTLSFGYRPRRGPLRALATAEKLYQECELGVWVSVDLRDAFGSVPVGRLPGVVRHYIPDDGLIELLKAVTRPGLRPGLRQGSPFSPLMLNLYLHHTLDLKWQGLRPDTPLLRFADDILLMCDSRKRAKEAYRDLVELLRPAGFELKEDVAQAVVSLNKGKKVEWMGYSIGIDGDNLRFDMTPRSWARLAELFADAQHRPNSPLAAIASLAGWIADKAPCYPHTPLVRAYGKIARIAGEQGFDEILDAEDLKGHWQRAFARWRKLVRKVAKTGIGF